MRKNQDDSHENSRGREFPLSFETNSQLTSVLHISGLGVGPASWNEASVLVFIFSIVCCYVFVAIHFSLFNYGFLSANLRYTAVGCWPNLLVFLNYDAICDSLFEFLLLWCVLQPEDVIKNISRIASAVPSHDILCGNRHWSSVHYLVSHPITNLSISCPFFSVHYM